MLRMSHLPSDFHPLLLVLGDHTDLARFAEMLAAFARTGRPIQVGGEGGAFSTDTDVLLEPADGAPGRPRGLWRDPAKPGALRWTLSRDEAGAFALEVAELANSNAPAGSVTLECGILNEIRVKVSVGEWEDEFLTDGVR